MNTTMTFILKRAAIAVVCVALIAGPRALAAESGDESDFVYAKKAFNDGFYDLSQERLESYLKSYPQSPHQYEAHMLLGRACYYRNNLAGALYEFESVLSAPQASEFHDEALYWTGEIFLKNGDYKKALSLYEQVVTSFPASRYAGYAVYSKGWAYYRLGLYNEAIACFEDVVKNRPYEKIAVESQFRLGECQYLMARYAAAETALEQFIEKYPVSEKTADAYYMLGEASFYRGRYGAALASFERSLSIMPKAPWAPFARYRVAGSLFGLGEFERSVSAYKRCLEDPTDEFLRAASMMGLLRAYQELGSVDEALRLADEIIAKRAADEITPEAHYRKARLLYNAGRYAEAEEACRASDKDYPRSEYADEIGYELGWICIAQGKSAAAIDAFTLVLNESSDVNLRASAACKIGDIYFDTKEYGKASEFYDVVLGKYPDSFWADYAQYQVGAIFSLTGKSGQAIMAYQSVLTNFPNSSWRNRSLYGLGEAYYRSGDYERSIAEFRRLIDAEDADAALRTNARLYLANALYAMKKYEDAVAVLRAVDSGTADPEIRMMARYQTGWCYDGMGREAEALAIFSGLLKEHPQAPIALDVRFWFADHYRSKGEYAKARSYYEEIAGGQAADRAVEEALYNAAMTYIEEGKPDQALSRFDDLALRFPGSAVAKTALRKTATIMKEMKNYDGAVASLSKALTKENTELNAQVQFEIAECYEAKAEAAKAVEEYLKVPYLYPAGTFWSVRAQLKCAQLLERMERYDDAKTIYEKLARMDIEESEFARQRLEWLKWRKE